MKGCMAERHTYISSSMRQVHALEVPYIASKPFPFLQPDAAPTSFSMRASIIPWWLERTRLRLERFQHRASGFKQSRGKQEKVLSGGKERRALALYGVGG